MNPPTCFSTTVEHTLAAARTLSDADRLRLACAIVGTLPHDYASINLGITADGVALVASMPDASRDTSLYGEGFGIDGAKATICAVDVHAIAPPLLRDDERAKLDGMEPRTVPPSTTIPTVTP